MFTHVPVLLQECIEGLNIKSKGHLYCFDQDQQAIDESKDRLKLISNEFTIIHANFMEIKEKLAEENVFKVDGILFDLGVSSAQFDEGDRGFSYRYDAIQTTFELVEIIKESLPKKALLNKGHPAKQVFQAIRIEVNDELTVLKKGLRSALELLNCHGRVVVITFNSLEDRIVKNIFKEYTFEGEGSRLIPLDKKDVEYILVNRKVILPSEKEMEDNPRSKSAKLRIIERK